MSYIHKEADPDAQGDPDGTQRHASSEDELDFSMLFDYDYLKPIEEPTPSHKIISPPSGVAHPPDEISDYGLKPYSPLAFPRLSANPMGRYGQPDSIGSRYCLDPIKAAGAPALSPRIEITPSHELIHSGVHFRSRDSDLLVEHQSNTATTSPRFTLPVPGFEGYREPACLSPASSGSSASFISETSFSPYTSPCVSPNNGPSDDPCPQFQNIHTPYSPRTSPIMSPRASITEDTCLGPHSPSPRPYSRSSSPGAKRKYSCAELYNPQQPTTSPRHSRSPSPQPSPHIGLREDSSSVTYSQLSSSPSLMDAMNNLTTDVSCGVPIKMWKTSPEPSPLTTHKGSIPCHVFQTAEYLGTCEQEDNRNPGPESILLVSPTWPKQLVPAIPICSLPVASLPPLEWPLSSQSGPYELQIEVQPKPHHRAHYETEGSRGAVKACTGGHPVVQLHGYMDNKPLGLQIFIGTADERILKPHAFYQVHRITGKTVTTTSYEKIIGNTKVLEIPLEPKSNMKATIDCAGILKLRNADIELRKGETDIGRKNTRVRLVFRVHIPEPSGRIVSLQVASTAIECSQRSAHELPMVERLDIDSCLVYGGQQMILTGQNFTAESKVVFTEKTSDGQQIWEMEATVDKDKSQPSMLFVEIPEYRNKLTRIPVKVNFQVINGKRKRSQPQHFTYLPVPSIKTEPIDDYNPSLIRNTVPGGLGTLPQSYYPQHTVISDSPSCLVGNMAACQQARSGLPPPDSRYPPQDPAAATYQRSRSLSPSQPGYQQPNLLASQITLPDVSRSVLAHAGSPGQAPAMLHHSSANQQSPPPPVIHYSPANQVLRCGSHQEFQHIMCCENFTSGLSRAGQPQASQTQRISPSSYPTVIQQQSASPRAAKHGPPASEQKEILPGGVTVKQEPNLDQAYLDDEEHAGIFLKSVTPLYWTNINNVAFSRPHFLVATC
ncbi:nuclear factor of activated T-cells, cytoplasmic 2 isoform X2 [Rhinatrema bivittatum]|uniref:nuclear factor of activated T-cells, cytoplasmic 2 isoform X2 n=1 Tax=Rhinatrema bivittatum TaxID=194408 RepID=UPI0011293363|nr:nuclear factor of activated T-cells, cytoplasmic 2 isoform X2 [Rhinatrema bivittatum]